MNLNSKTRLMFVADFLKRLRILSLGGFFTINKKFCIHSTVSYIITTETSFYHPQTESFGKKLSHIDPASQKYYEILFHNISSSWTDFPAWNASVRSFSLRFLFRWLVSKSKLMFASFFCRNDRIFITILINHSYRGWARILLGALGFFILDGNIPTVSKSLGWMNDIVS